MTQSGGRLGLTSWTLITISAALLAVQAGVAATQGTRDRAQFSYRSPPCVAVMSYARMEIGGSPELRAARLRKMTAKNLGVLVYGLPRSRAPRSLMFDDILGLEDLDFMEENFNRAGMAPDDRK